MSYPLPQRPLPGHSRRRQRTWSPALTSSATQALPSFVSRRGLAFHARHQGNPLARHHHNRDLIPYTSASRFWWAEEGGDQEHQFPM